MASLSIDKTTTFADLQNWFSESFPNLRIEFYKNDHSKGEGNPLSEQQKELNFPVIEGDENPSELTIFEDYSTNLVEHIFRTKLHLNVQVFRKNGNSWLQTISTDNWTLKEQMDRALFHAQA